MNFNQLIDMMYRAKGIKHLADVARELDVSPQVVSNWKARNQVPYKYVVMVNERFGGGDQERSEIEESAGAAKTRGEEVQAPMPYGPYAFPEEDEVSLWEIIDVLKQNLRLILAVPTVTCVITIINVLFIAQPVFTSTAKIMSSSSGDISQAAGLAAQFGINLPTSQSEPQWVYPEIIKSRTLARTMLKRKFDTEKYGPQKPLLQILTYGDEEPEVGLDTLIRSGVDAVIGMIEITKDGSFYNLEISAPEPLFVRDFAIAILEELDAHQREYNSAKVSETRKFIEERIVETEKELSSAEEALKNFRERNRLISNSPALQLEQQRYSREVAVLTGVFTSLKQQLETSKIEEVRESEYVVVLDPPEAPLYKSSPKRMLSVLLAGILGIGLGIGMAFVRNWYESSKAEDE